MPTSPRFRRRWFSWVDTLYLKLILAADGIFIAPPNSGVELCGSAMPASRSAFPRAPANTSRSAWERSRSPAEPSGRLFRAATEAVVAAVSTRGRLLLRQLSLRLADAGPERAASASARLQY